MITRRNLIATGALGAATVGLAACGNSGGSSSNPTDKAANDGKTITLWIMEGTNAKTDEYVKALQEEFTEHTGATLKVEVQPWDGAHDKFVTAMAGGTGPDVAEIGTTWTPEFADAGGLDDLTEDVKKAGIDSDLVDALKEAGTLDGKLYGMPWYAGIRSILANKEILEAAGVNSQPQSWDDLLAMIETLKAKNPDVIPFPVNGGSPFALLPFIWGAGGDIAEGSGKDWKATINEAPAVEGLTWYTDLALKHGSSTEAASTWKETDSLKQFQEGKVAMFITGSWVPATVKASDEELFNKLTAFTIPAKDSAIAASFVGGSHLCRFLDSEEPELAFELIKLMTTGEFATRWSEETNFFPGTKSALDETIKNGTDLTKVFASQMTEAGKSVPVTPMWGQIEGKKTLPNLLSNVLAGGQAPQAAADAAAKEMDGIFGA